MKSIFWLEGGYPQVIIGDEGALITDRYGPFGSLVIWMGLFFALFSPMLFDPYIYSPFFRDSLTLEISGLILLVAFLIAVSFVIQRLQSRRYQKMNYDQIQIKFTKGSRKNGTRYTPSQFINWLNITKARLDGNRCLLFWNYEGRKFYAGSIFRKEFSPDILSQKSQSEMFENFTNFIREKLGEKLEVKSL